MRVSGCMLQWFCAGLVIVFMGALPLGRVHAQGPLGRIEESIRTRTPTGEAAAPGAVVPAAAPGMPSGGTPPVVSQPPGSVRTAQTPAYLGATCDDRNDRGRGVRVLSVARGSPAERAGLRGNDLITGLAGSRVRQMADLGGILEAFKPGDTVVIELQRDNRPQQVKATLAQRPATAAVTPKPTPPAPLPGIGGTGAATPRPIAPGPALPPPTPRDDRAGVPPVSVAPRPGEGDIARTIETPPPGPRLTASPEASATPTVEALQRRIAELESRVAELERALAEVKKER